MVNLFPINCTNQLSLSYRDIRQIFSRQQVRLVVLTGMCVCAEFRLACHGVHGDQGTTLWSGLPSFHGDPADSGCQVYMYLEPLCLYPVGYLRLTLLTQTTDPQHLYPQIFSNWNSSREKSKKHLPSVAAYTYKPSSKEAGARGWLQDWEQPGLHSKLQVRPAKMTQWEPV